MSGNKIIHWQYPGEGANRILGADNYTVQQDRPMFEYDGRKRYFIHATAIVANPVPPTGPYTGNYYLSGEQITCRSLGSFDAPIWDITPDFRDLNVHWNITYTRAEGGTSKGGYCEKRTVRIIPYHSKRGVHSGSVIHEVESWKFPSISKLPDPKSGKVGFFDWRLVEHTEATSKACLNELPQKCQFKIYQDGNLVYQRSESVCPQVWESKPECPPGTCPVECGGHICCYDKLGNPVTSIPK